MGIEQGINNILSLSQQILQTMKESQDIGQIRTALEKSLHNFSVVVLDLETKFQESAQSIIHGMRESYAGLNPEVLASIAQLPPVLDSLETSLAELGVTFKQTGQDIKEDLKTIKVSYVEDVVGRTRKLSESITEMVETSTERSSNQYEASISSFVSISEDLKAMQSNLNALIENQSDQLATVAELRDRVSAIIQVELASLRDHININLESSVTELKTSVTERLMVQDGSIQKLTQAIERLDQSIVQLPAIVKNEINLGVEEKIIPTIKKMDKDMKKLTALVMKAVMKKPSEP